jgi:hypothetical protein
MTYQTRPIAPFKVDILSTSNPSSYSAGYTIPCTGVPSRTNATVNSSGEIKVYSGSHWRLEYSPVFGGSSQFEIQFFSITDNNYIGQSLFATTQTQNIKRKGRCVCTALILNSDINTFKEIKIQIVSETNMEEGPSYLGDPCLRIFELPA